MHLVGGRYGSFMLLLAALGLSIQPPDESSGGVGDRSHEGREGQGWRPDVEATVAVVAESEASTGEVGAGVKLNRWCAGGTAVCAIRSSAVDEWCDGEVSGKAVSLRQLSLWLDVLVVGGFADAAWL
jgi:hypothetical protein